MKGNIIMTLTRHLALKILAVLRQLITQLKTS